MSLKKIEEIFNKIASEIGDSLSDLKKQLSYLFEQKCVCEKCEEKKEPVAPIVEEPKKEPVVETPAPIKEEPVVETPKVEEPKKEEPAPIVETPTPVVETPETPVTPISTDEKKSPSWIRTK